MNLKYLALGILVGCLAPYALTLIKAKKDPDLSTSPENFEDETNY